MQALAVRQPGGCRFRLRGFQNMRLVTIGSLAAACVLLSACATVTRGTRQTFKIDSTPTEAKVELSNGETCVTPCVLKLKRRPGFTATFTKDGFQSQTVNVDSE